MHSSAMARLQNNKRKKQLKELKKKLNEKIEKEGKSQSPSQETSDPIENESAETFVPESETLSETLGEDDTQQDGDQFEETSETGNANDPIDLENTGNAKVTGIAPEKKVESKKTWAGLFTNNRKSDEGFQLYTIGTKGGRIQLEDDDIDELESSWGYGLLGYIAGKNPGKGAIIDCCRSWQVRFQPHFHPSGWIVIKFENEHDRDSVLTKGPYMIFGRPFIVKQMPEMFNFDDNEITKIPMWLRFPNLPVQLWNDKALSKIATTIGTPIRTDRLTRTKDRLFFARVFVEIDISEDLVNTVFVEHRKRSFVQNVEYEYIPKYCRHCKVLGHEKKFCSKYLSTIQKPNPEVPANDPPAPAPPPKTIPPVPQNPPPCIPEPQLNATSKATPESHPSIPTKNTPIPSQSQASAPVETAGTKQPIVLGVAAFGKGKEAIAHSLQKDKQKVSLAPPKGNEWTNVKSKGLGKGSRPPRPK